MDHTTLCAANLQSELRVADIPEQDWPDAETVRNLIYGEKKKSAQDAGRPQLPKNDPVPMPVLHAALAPFTLSDVSARVSWFRQNRTNRKVKKAFVPFSCRAFWDALENWRPGTAILLAADAKVSRGDRVWRTATIGYFKKGALVRSSQRRCGRDGAVIALPAYATSCRPLLQAHIRRDTHENWTLCCEVFPQLVAEVLGALCEEFVQSILSLAINWSPATENARRPIGDITHMWARFRHQLPKKCKEGLSQEPTVASSKTHAWQIQRGTKALCDSCSNTRNFGRSPALLPRVLR